MAYHLKFGQRPDCTIYMKYTRLCFFFFFFFLLVLRYSASYHESNTTSMFFFKTDLKRFNFRSVFGQRTSISKR